MSKVTKTTIARKDGEYIVRAYGADGRRLPDCDYFTDDADDARNTASAMCSDCTG